MMMMMMMMIVMMMMMMMMIAKKNGSVESIADNVSFEVPITITGRSAIKVARLQAILTFSC